MNQRFELDGARKGAFDAFAHGRHFAADRLADHHDAILRHVLGLGEPERHLGHGLRGDAHVLRAAHHRREGPEQHDGNDGRDQHADKLRTGEQLVHRADAPDGGTEDHVGKRCGARDPRDRDEGHDPVDRVRRAPVQAVQKRAVVLLAIVVRRRERRRLGRAFVGAIRLRLDRAQLLLAGGRRRCGGRCRRLVRRGARIAGPTGAGQFLGRLRDLRFQILHGRSDIQVAARFGIEVYIQRLLEFSGYVAVERFCCCAFLRHAFATLYWCHGLVVCGFSTPAHEA